ncbi:MAG TPA: tetratricopeptide repeat protein [Pyrinomonadaceae bacterium]
MVPPLTRAFGARGAAKFTQGKLDEALADLKEAVKAEPKEAANYERLGDASARLGDMEQARDAWGKALSLSDETDARTRLKAKLAGASKE